MENWFYVYILASDYNGTLYIGHTDNLEQRYKTHRSKNLANSFTAKYNVTQLVYFEKVTTRAEAQIREKQLKKLSRTAKIKLIESHNPHWLNLGASW
ncbi:MAG: GIY-YIG nuclease family protein [Proteobacteria bacterium]|nr:GIY-YIG nuclease family protein [Pseudomonadota bacterium]NBX86522.1 GIY-YIG nuclease family protein [Pseudomonadota bacterium]